jgi:glucose-6-phosphate isomerase
MANADESPLRVDMTNALASAVGAEHGLTNDELSAISSGAQRWIDNLKTMRASGEVGFYDLPAKTEEAAEIAKVAGDIRSRFDDFVVMGIGGSALGVTTLVSSIGGPFHNMLPASNRGPRVWVLDNVDPEFVADLLELVDPKRTMFNVITKSGSTAETMAQFLIVWNLLKGRLGESFKDNIIATTDPEKGALRSIVCDEKLRSFAIPANVGGRFSVMTPVGLLAGAVAGVDITRLLSGAAKMLDAVDGPEIESNPALAFAGWHYIGAANKGKSISVMMPYSQRLREVADWYRQLWAESLGKRVDRSGNVVNVGQTPVKALGVTDQHSQVQLYREGPNDKLFTFISVGEHRRDVKIPRAFGDVDTTAYLGGASLGRLFDAEREATAIALTEAQRPNITIELPRVDEESLGALLFMLESATALAGEMFDINVFDQPGVEAGKVATYSLMGRPGYEDELDSIRKALADRGEGLVSG